MVRELRCRRCPGGGQRVPRIERWSTRRGPESEEWGGPRSSSAKLSLRHCGYCCTAQLSSAQLSSAQLSSAQLSSAQLSSAQLSAQQPRPFIFLNFTGGSGEEHASGSRRPQGAGWLASPTPSRAGTQIHATTLYRYRTTNTAECYLHTASSAAARHFSYLLLQHTISSAPPSAPPTSFTSTSPRTAHLTNGRPPPLSLTPGHVRYEAQRDHARASSHRR